MKREKEGDLAGKRECLRMKRIRVRDEGESNMFGTSKMTQGRNRWRKVGSVRCKKITGSIDVARRVSMEVN